MDWSRRNMMHVTTSEESPKRCNSCTHTVARIPGIALNHSVLHKRPRMKPTWIVACCDVIVLAVAATAAEVLVASICYAIGMDEWMTYVDI